MLSVAELISWVTYAAGLHMQDGCGVAHATYSIRPARSHNCASCKGTNTANGSATDEAFTFIGTAAFSNVAGQLRYEVMGTSSVVMGDQNGDALADFWIRVDGAPALVSTDFIL